jgi:hypothetical protein
MSNDNNVLSEPMKYSMIRVKEDTLERFYRYVGKRTQETSARVTADDAINELLDSAGVE